MSYNHILTLTPEFGLDESLEFRSNITESPDGKEFRDNLWDYGIREYKLTCRYLTKDVTDYIWNFYTARKGRYDYFLVKILTEYQIESENVGTANGVTATFNLNVFPVDTTANHSCTVNGVANTNYTLSNNFTTEVSSITFNPIPAVGTILVSYENYFKVRFAEDKLTRQLVAYQLLHTGMTLREVRWDIYNPSYSSSSSSSSRSSSSSSSKSISSSSKSSSSSSSSRSSSSSSRSSSSSSSCSSSSSRSSSSSSSSSKSSSSSSSSRSSSSSSSSSYRSSSSSSSSALP